MDDPATISPDVAGDEIVNEVQFDEGAIVCPDPRGDQRK